MSEVEQSRDDAGRFEGGGEQLFGREAAEVKAGYIPAQKEKEPEFDVAEGAEILDAVRAEDEAPTTEVFYQDPDGERMNADPEEGPVKAVSIEEAAADLAAYRDANGDTAAKSISKDFAAEIDALRGDAEKAGIDLKATGVEKVSPTAEVPEGDVASDKSGDEPAVPGSEHVDPEVAKALQNPTIKAALESEFAKAEQAKVQFSQTLDAAQRIAQGVLLELAPGLASIPAEHLGQALQELSATDPVRANMIAGALDKAQRIEFAQAQQRAELQQMQRQQSEALRQQYNRQADEAIGPMTHAEKMAIADELVDYVGRHGVTREQLVHEMSNNLALNHPAFQKMATDAVRYNRLMNSTLPRPVPAVPPVQRPGVAQRFNRSEAATSDLERRFASASGDKQLELAAALTGARRSARKG
ncbi:hypothetical protein JOE51_006788 [Bradyrhizobium japonicum]|uniref:hypothetical protein n=1 Tax=Bradyrhizobium diazoefficiens TaxID=1355477 RepID=UPI001B5BBB59|nr:hypothetical protein [Bradyrhizobium japonicum]